MRRNQGSTVLSVRLIWTLWSHKNVSNIYILEAQLAKSRSPAHLRTPHLAHLGAPALPARLAAPTSLHPPVHCPARLPADHQACCDWSLWAAGGRD